MVLQSRRERKSESESSIGLTGAGMSRAEFSASLRGGGWGNIAYGCDAGRCRYGCGYAGMGVGRQAGEGADAESTCQKIVMIVGMDFVFRTNFKTWISA